MLEVFTFFLVLAILRVMRRTARHPQPPLRVDVYLHLPSSGDGERRPQESPMGDNVVPFPTRLPSSEQRTRKW